jgi:predicted nuclease of restriction endonuclease-like (RecB) superfamily
MKTIADTAMLTTPEYRKFIEDLKARVTGARISAARAVNRDLILLYWDIGNRIVDKQQTLGWGESVVEMVSADLRREFPQMTGFSPRNVWDMKRFYLAYADEAIWRQAVVKLPGSTEANIAEILRQPVAEFGRGKNRRQPVAKLTEMRVIQFLRQLVAEIPWGHNLLVLNKVTDPAARLYYLSATARSGWSRNVLLNQIKANAYERAVTDKSTHNFALALPEHLAEQADEMLKSSYNLEFLGIRRAVKERELEDRLIERLRDFILELGYGFCFVGRQYRLALGKKEYFIDLLFYHRFLKALVAFDLKVGPFEPEYAGKMDFYLNLLNDKERATGDNPSIGIILCAEKDDVEVEYALRTKTNPIGVAVYQMQSKLPGEMKGKLPTAKQLAGVVRVELEGKR